MNRLENGNRLRISGGNSGASVESALIVMTLEKAIDIAFVEFDMVQLRDHLRTGAAASG